MYVLRLLLSDPKFIMCKKSRKEAESYIKSLFPHIKIMNEGMSYYCKNLDRKAVLCFIRKEEL